MASTQKVQQVFSTPKVKHGLSFFGSDEFEAVESLLVGNDSKLFVHCQIKEGLVQGQVFIFQHSLSYENDR